MGRPRTRTLEIIREKDRKYRNDHPERYMLTEAKRRAKKYGLDFNLELEDIVIPEVCPALGIPLFSGGLSEGKRMQGPNSPSLDRVDSSKGYVKDNVRVISWRANKIKSNATADELEKI